MDDILGEIGKGFLRGLGYLLAEIFFGTICYWVGWPICKLLTLGKYPVSNQLVYLDTYTDRDNGFWCCTVGLVAILAICFYVSGQFG
jgi:hypothetical protein